MAAFDVTSPQSFDVSIDSSAKPAIKKDHARSRILHTALSRFASRGYDGVSTTEIAKAAGVTQPLIHYHFKSKETLWKATVEQVFGWMRDELVESWQDEVPGLPQEQQAEQKLRRFLAQYLDFSSRHPEFGQLIFREGTQHSERLEWLVSEWMQPLLEPLMKEQAKGIEEGWLRDIPFAHIASILSASGTAFFSMTPLIESAYGVNAQDGIQSKAYTDTVIEMICQLIFVNKSKVGEAGRSSLEVV